MTFSSRIGSLMVASIALIGANESSKREPAAVPADLVRTIARYDEATTHNDVRALSEIVVDDYRLVNSDMSVQNKASYLVDFKIPGFRIVSYRLTKPFFIVRNDSALTGGRIQLSWKQEGKQHHRTLRISHFWVNRDGEWHLAYTQLTRKPQT